MESFYVCLLKPVANSLLFLPLPSPPPPTPPPEHTVHILYVDAQEISVYAYVRTCEVCSALNVGGSDIVHIWTCILTYDHLFTCCLWSILYVHYHVFCTFLPPFVPSFDLLVLFCASHKGTLSLPPPPPPRYSVWLLRFVHGHL